MRSLLVISLMLVLGACTRMSADFHLDNAYRQYAAGDCAAVALELSQAQRQIRSRPYLQPEISLLRGQCLEREHFFVDAQQTYQPFTPQMGVGVVTLAVALAMNHTRRPYRYPEEKPIVG